MWLRLIVSAKAMIFEKILEIGDRARWRARLPADDRLFLREEIPREMAAFPSIIYPPRMRHPGGFTISGAVVRTFVKAALVLGARRAFGRRFDAEVEFYDRVARDLTLGMALSHFRHGDPKGAYCCAHCTLAIYPVLQARALRLVDCGQLSEAVRGLIESRGWRFSRATSPKVIQWSLRGEGRQPGASGMCDRAERSREDARVPAPEGEA